MEEGNEREFFKPMFDIQWRNVAYVVAIAAIVILGAYSLLIVPDVVTESSGRIVGFHMLPALLGNSYAVEVRLNDGELINSTSGLCFQDTFRFHICGVGTNVTVLYIHSGLMESWSITGIGG